MSPEGEEITAQNGRYGPYLRKGTDSRSLESEDQLFTVTLAEAEAVFAQPKRGRGRAAKPPLAELGPHPESGAPIRVLDGRFGPYITDGTVNASVPARRRPRVGHRRAGRRAAARAGAARAGHEEARGEEARREEEGAGEEEGSRRRRRPPAKKAPAKKRAPAKKAPATHVAGPDGPRRRSALVT